MNNQGPELEIPHKVEPLQQLKPPFSGESSLGGPSPGGKSKSSTGKKRKKERPWWYKLRKIMCPCLTGVKKKLKKKMPKTVDSEIDIMMVDNPMQGKAAVSSTMMENPMRAALAPNSSVRGTHTKLEDEGNREEDSKDDTSSPLPSPATENPSSSPSSKDKGPHLLVSRPTVSPLRTPRTQRKSIVASVGSLFGVGNNDAADEVKDEVKTVETPPANPRTVRKSIFAMLSSVVAVEKEHGDDAIVNSVQSLVGSCQSGWVYRENELAQHDRNEVLWIKLWACIVGKHLLYSKAQPNPDGTTVADGYIDLLPGTSVKFTHLHKLGVASSESKGEYCFNIKEPNDTEKLSAPFSITFSATSEKHRQEWVDAIKAAVDTPEGAPCTGLAPLRTSALSDESIDTTAVELPRKIGMLKKHAVGGFLGVKTVHQRWFRLEGGELRYYADEDMRPIKLKGTINLYSGVLLETSTSGTDNGTSIHIQVDKEGKEGTKVLIVEAASPKEAKEWRMALEETLLALRMRGNSMGRNKRRQNLADIGGSNVAKEDDEQVGDSASWEMRMEARSEQLIASCSKSHFLMKKIQDTRGLVASFKRCTRLPGDIIIAQGAPGDFFYILETGSAHVVVSGHKVGVIPAGKTFGDLALLNSSARTATIKAATVCRMWTLDRFTLRKFLSEHEKKEMSDKMTFLKSVKLFEQISDYSLEKVADVLQQQTFKPGEVIFRRGESGECFYMVITGKVSIYLSSITGGRSELVRLGAKKFFGELALMDNAPRKASASAIERTTCWTVDRSNFVALVGSVKQAREESIGVMVLKKVKLMAGLSDKQLITVARCLTTVEFPQGETIIHQGEDGDTFYMIASGEVKVEVNHVEVAHLSDHAFFGEGSLMKNEKRSATVIAHTDVVCLSLSRIDFNRLLGSVAEQIKEQAAEREAVAKKAEGGLLGQLDDAFDSLFSSSELAKGLDKSRQGQSDAQGLLASTNKLFDLDQLDRVHMLGRGTFGTVYLVRHTQNDTFYALKVFHKQHLHKTHQERCVFGERDTMKTFDHSFFTALYATFQDERCLYMVQQFIPGGDMYGVIHGNNDSIEMTRIGGLEPDVAAFYAANVLVVLGNLIEMDTVFRDLKPENFGVDTSGYLRVYDFGCAKVLVGEETTNTMMGTPEYLSPEVITSRGHARGVDIWSFGVFLYEMLTSRTPFDHANSAMIYQNIVDSDELLKVAFSKHFDPDARDLIQRLLIPNPHMRLGMLREGIKDVWAHRFFTRSGKEERQMSMKNYPAPFRPKDTAQCETDLNDLMIGNFDSDIVPAYTGKFDFSSF